MRSQRFGIELEFTGATREGVRDAVCEYFNTTRYVHTRGYSGYEVEDSTGRGWKILRDGSIIPERKTADGRTVGANDDYKVELVSPILKYEDIVPLQELIRHIRNTCGIFANRSCGIHIHVDAHNHTAKTLRHLSNIVCSKEDLLYKALNVRESRLRYCKKTDMNFIEKINKKRPQTLQEVADLWYGNQSLSERSRHYNETRYHALNLHSTFTKHTVEFRCFNGSVHAGKVKAYIQFCLAVNHQAMTLRASSYKKPETTNDRYTFRCWLLRLGLSGDEFKTCRHHLLKNLEGNSAWRNGAVTTPRVNQQEDVVESVM